jgi:hypothetical protein
MRETAYCIALPGEDPPMAGQLLKECKNRFQNVFKKPKYGGVIHIVRLLAQFMDSVRQKSDIKEGVPIP